MKRTVAVFVMIIMILLLSAVPALAEDAPVGIIGAMESEVSMILDSMENAGMEEISGMQFWSGTIHGCPAVLVQCGVGKVNAAMAAQTLAVHYGACAIINTGVAGALDERLNVGDLVISTDAVQHDFDLGSLSLEGANAASPIKADPEMRQKALRAAKKVAAKVQVFEGRICSGDQFIAGHAKKQSLVERFGGYCCEMEGGAVAQACQLSGVPFVIIRAISDKADDSGEVSFSAFADAVARRSAAIVSDMLENFHK